MVKTQVIWSRTAIKKLYAIFESDVRKGNGKDFSADLFKKISKQMRLLIKNPYIGMNTSDDSVRGLIIDSFLICYGVQDNLVSVYTISEYSNFSR